MALPNSFMIHFITPFWFCIYFTKFKMWKRKIITCVCDVEFFYDSLTAFNVYLFCHHIQILVIIRSMCKCWKHNPSYKKRNLCLKFKQKKVFPFSTPFIFFCFVNLKWCVYKRNTRLFMFELKLIFRNYSDIKYDIMVVFAKNGNKWKIW